MSIHNLAALFEPKSIALIGASRRPQSVGQVVARNLFQAGFAGPIMPVNPHDVAIEGALAYPSVDDLPIVPDLAVIATPPATIPALIDQLGRRGTRGAVVLSAGFGELGAEGKALEASLIAAARPYGLRIIGPNCLGIAVPASGVNASFSPGAPPAGEIAFIAQSGAVLTSVLDWARGRNIGFSHLISLGAMVDVDFGDLLDYFAEAPHVRAILLYIEAIKDARKFMSAARRAARIKPVIVVKAGRRPEGAKAATSHTGALAGADDVYDAAFRRAGLLRVRELEELFAAVETLASGISIQGDRLAIVTNGGGVGVMATDSLIDEGGKLAQLTAETIAKLNDVLPRTWSHGNPIDIIGDAPGQRYGDAMAAVLADPNVDGVLVMNCPAAIADSLDAARAVAATVDKLKDRSAGGRPKPPIVGAWLGGPSTAPSRQHLAEHRIPNYETPELAVRAVMHLVRYRANQALLREVPPSLAGEFDVDTPAAKAILALARAQGRAWLSEAEAKDVLTCYGVPVARTKIARHPEDVAVIAQSLLETGAKAIALKILSPDITHKSDVGGVALNLGDADEARAAAEAMLTRVGKVKPHARIEGFTVQDMIDRSDGIEAIAGMVCDPTFGPVILVGQGGTAVEVIGDKAVAMVPLNLPLALDAIEQTRMARLLDAHRGKAAADRTALALTLVKLSHLVIEAPDILEIDINPLLVTSRGVVGLDARIKVRLDGDPIAQRPAIRPYPKALESRLVVNDGRSYPLRPIRPEDAPLLQEMIEKVTPEDTRLRFFSPLRHLPPAMAARLSQIDYDREMALVVTGNEPASPEILAVVRITADTDGERAEYAILVRSDVKGQGLGWNLMNRIIDYARQRGLKQIYGHVLRENVAMLEMDRELGFTLTPEADDPAIVRVSYDLTRAVAG